MSNFKPSGRVPLSRFQPQRAAAAVAIAVPPPQFRPFPKAPARAAVVSASALQTPQIAFFFLLCVYLLASLANDWTLRAFGSRAYISIVAGVLLPFLLMGSGQAFRALSTNVGRWAVAFAVWMALCIPFSTWRADSLSLVTSFMPKDYIIFLYISAAAVTFPQLKRLMDVLGIGGIIVILSCVFFGGDDGGRFMIPGSNFFENPNDLAFQLVINMGLFTYWSLSRNWFPRICGMVLFFATAMYEIKTGSRGSTLALAAAVGTTLICLRHKLKAGFVLALVLAVAIIPFIASSQQLQRLTKINIFSEPVTVADADTLSQDIRVGLFWRGVDITVTHPVFGIGPGQFEEFVWGEAKRQGIHVPSLKSHDTYIQVSSEMGIPGLIIYLGFLLGSLGLSLRVFRLASKDPQYEDLSNIALCLFVMLVAYSVGSAFHHMGYSRHLPILGGLTIATWFQARQVLPALQPEAVSLTRF